MTARARRLPFAAGAVVAALACGACQGPRGLHVGVENADSLALDSVVVGAGGRSYTLGTIDPGEERTVRVEVADTSAVWIEHGSAARTRLPVGTRLAPGQNLTVIARVKGDSVVHVTNIYGG